MEPLVALSIRQPWIDMIVQGAKTIEIRTWKVQRRGLIALHAPRRIDFSAAYLYGYRSPWTLPRSKVIAVAEIADVVELNEESWLTFVTEHRQPLPMAEGAYAVFLKNVRPLQRPVACKGRQMLFPLGEDIAERVRSSVPLQIPHTGSNE